MRRLCWLLCLVNACAVRHDLRMIDLEDSQQAGPQLGDMLRMWAVVPVARTLVQLGMPDAVPLDGEISLDTVATNISVDADMLQRSVRYVAGFGVFEERPGGAVAHSRLSRLLCVGGPLRNQVLFLGSEDVADAFVHGFSSVLKDPSKSAFKHMHGQDYLTEWLPKHPESEAVFGRYMTDSTASDTRCVDTFEWPEHGTIADIGGGNGQLLRDILKKRPGASGVLFDLPSAIATAQTYWPEDDLMYAGRVQYVGGSFLTAVNVAADIYVLKWILHDWDDTSCVTILSNILKSAPLGAHAVIFDHPVPDSSPPNVVQPSYFSDLTMATLYGGKERTLKELLNLAELSNWSYVGGLKEGTGIVLRRE